MIRVGFTLIGGRNWLGGANYLFNLLQAVERHAPGEVQSVLFVGTDATTESVARFQNLDGCEIVRTNAMNDANKLRALVSSLLFGRYRPFVRELATQRIDVMFEAAIYFGWRLGTPVLTWMPDFQHRALPQNFRRFGWLRRDLGYRAQMHGKRLIMLSSSAARVACAKYYPVDMARVRVVRFAVPSPPAIDPVTARATADRYGLPEQFFFMPNQYFVHKNHMLVLEALQPHPIAGAIHPRRRGGREWIG